MVLILRAALCGLAAMAAGACTSEQDSLQPLKAASDEESISTGLRLAQRDCSGCHAAGATGESRNADAPPLRTLAERYPASLLAEAFPERMKVGHPAMPEFRLSPSEVDALLSYLLSIQERQGA
jgi:mono/diheme cytochrome c family protein